ncbi:mandelate racemase/muconate lactonizing enzyme family protein [Neobacillus sp. Marseille-QA0830]
MKIVNVEPIVIDLPLDRPVQTSFGEMTRRTNVLVRIEANTGEFGIGEIWNNFPSWGAHEKVSTLIHGVRPLLLGEDPREIGKINHKLFKKLTTLCLQWGAVGPMHHSISGVDIALWDLIGKHYGLPIHKLLGGKIHEEVEVYASGLGPTLSDELVLKHQEMGITSFKLKVGKDTALDLQNLKRLRDLIGPVGKLMIDANQAWNRQSAIQNLLQFTPFDLTWIEEPIPCDDIEGLRYIREATSIPVAAGENIYGRKQARKALELEAVDIIQPDLSKNGGISESKIIAEMAGSFDRPYAPHYLGGAVCFAASLHFFASVPGGLILEMDANPNPFREQLFTNPFIVKDGKVKIPEQPGLGFEMDQEFVDFYTVDYKQM